MYLHQEPGGNRPRGAEGARAGVGRGASRKVSRLVRLAAVSLAFAPAGASALMGDMPESICNLQPPVEGRELHIRARFVRHAQGAVLADPECPGRTLLVSDLSPLSQFAKEV